MDERPEELSEPAALRLGRAFVFALMSTVLIGALVGRANYREQVFTAEIVTEAQPVSLIGAIIEEKALVALTGELPGFGRLQRVDWSRRPQRYAKVTEHYEKGSQTYWLIKWDPPTSFEERYRLDDAMKLQLSDLRQRWTLTPDGRMTKLRIEQIYMPRHIAAAFQFAVERFFGAITSKPNAQEVLAADRLDKIAQWAVQHPRTSTTAIADTLRIVPEREPTEATQPE